MAIINLIFWSILSAVLYRLGGWGHGFNTKVRDLGVPSCMMAYMAISGHYTHWLWLCFILMFGAQTTYFKKDGTDAYWYNWLFVGLAFSISLLPFSTATGHWLGLLYRTLAVTAFTVLWSQLNGKAWIEESGRGFIQIITLPLLFV